MCRGPSFAAAVRRRPGPLWAKFRVEGIRTNIGFLRELLSDSEGPVRAW